jgi:N-acetylneuraminate synthase
MMIAEVGQAHDGSLGSVHAYIDALAATGVDAIKFQTHIADAESSIHEPFRVKFSKQDLTRIDYWRRMEFTPEQWKDIKNHCDEVGLEFISSPFSNAAVDLLEEVGAQRYKIGSGEVNNLLILKKIAQTGKPIIVSSGMSNFVELDETLNFLKPFGNNISILQCTTAYPTKPEEWGLNVIQELKDRYNLPVGFSDHSGDIYACLAAATLGAEIFEFHVVFDKRQFGPDTPASITIDQTAQLVKGIQLIRAAQRHRINKNDNSQFKDLKGIFEKSLAVNRDLPQGHILQFEDLEAKKPKGYGISANQFEQIIGKKLKHPLRKWDFLNHQDIVNE